MPGNEVADKVHNFFEQDNLPQGQHQSQVPGGNWQSLNNNQWVGSQRHVSAQLSSNLKNYGVHQSDSDRGIGKESPRMSLGTNLTQLTSRAEFAKNQPRNKQGSLNGFQHEHQGSQTRQNRTEFEVLGDDTVPDRHNLTSGSLSVLESQQGNAAEHRSFETRDSGRLETPDASTNFDFFGGQPQLMRGEQLGVPQPQPMQQSEVNELPLWQQNLMLKQLQELQRQQRPQSGVNEMPLWEQNLMFKQLQELQRQRQIQLLEQTGRMQNPMNHSSTIVKQAAGEHFPSVVDGMPIQGGSNFFWPGEHMGGDPKVPRTPQMLMANNMNWSPRGGSPAMQGSANGPVFSHEQGQAARSMGLVQQLDQSLYGAPVASTRGVNQFHSQGMSHDYDDMLNKARGNKSSECLIQSPARNNSFHGNQSVVFQDDVNMPDNHLVSKQEFHGRQDPSGWSGNLQVKAVSPVGPSQDPVSLDPTEKKILFNEDENFWEAPFSGGVNTGFGNSLGSTDFAFPSMQSGSWSALMQSAVAETSSSEMGVQEDWSGLNYQQADRSIGNQPGTFSDGGKERANWVDNMQSASLLTSRPFPLFDEANMDPSSSSIRGFQQPGIKSSIQEGQMVQNNVRHEFIQGTPKGAGQWLDQTSQQKSKFEGVSRVQPSMMVGNALKGAWDGQSYEQSESSAHSAENDLNTQTMQGSWAHRKSTPSYNIGGTLSDKQNGWNTNDSLSQSGDAASNMCNNLSNAQLSQRSDQKRGMNTERDQDIGKLKINDNGVAYSFPNLTGILNSSIGRTTQEISQQVQNRHRIDGENLGNYHHQFDKGKRILESSMNNSASGAGENCEGKQENFYQKENSNDSQKSNRSHHIVSGGVLRQNLSSGSDPHALTSGNQMFESQLGRAAFALRDFQHHSVGVTVDPTDATGHVTHSEGLSQQLARGPKGLEQGYFGQSKFVGHLRENTIDMGEGHSSGFQGNQKGPMEMPSRDTLPGYGSSIAGSFDGKTHFFAPNHKALQASQNMLELIHKVDQSREQRTVKHFGSSGTTPLSEGPESETSDASIAQLQGNQLSSSQGFGLRLGPPSQRLPISNHASSPQSHSQTVNDLNSGYVDSGVREKGKMWLGSTSSMQTSHHSHEMSRGENQDNKFSFSGQPGLETASTHDKSSGAITSGLLLSRNELQRQHMSGASGQVMSHHSFDRLTSHFRQPHDSQDGPLVDQSAQASKPAAISRIPSLTDDPLTDSSQITRTNSLNSKGSSQEHAVLESVAASQPSLMPRISEQGAFPVLPNVWNSVTSHHHLASGRPHKVPIQSINPSNNNASTLLSAQNPDSQEIKKGGNGPSDYGKCSVNSQHSFEEERLEKESSWRQSPSEKADLAPQTSGASQGTQAMAARALQQDFDRGAYGKDPALVSGTDHISIQTVAACSRDIEAFGRSLRPSQGLHQTSTLLHQVQAMKGVETGPTKSDAKRFKGADYGSEMQRIAVRSGQQLFCGQNSVARESADNTLKTAGHQSPFPSDGRPLTFSSVARENQNKIASSEPGLGDIPSKDGLTFDQKSHQIHSGHPSLTSGSSDRPQINPQMVPSWFEQYGTFKSGQMLLMHDAQDTVTNVSQNFIFGNSSESSHENTSTKQNRADARHFGGESASTIFLGGLAHSLPPDYANQSLAAVEPRKRKSAPLELLPWHKEVAHGSQRLQSVSTAEQDWAQAANRLIEKLEDETEMGEDGQLLLHSRGRLILTTQLMQQLLRPPLSAILSSDATSYYESVTYSVAKLALGDACSLISSYSGHDSHVTPENGSTTAMRIKANTGACNLYFVEVVESFISRAKKLETDLFRMDKRASILDLRLETQDLERFSVINRFAKFHGRANADVSDAASTSNTFKTCPQRYVTAFAMPRNVPEGVRCLSL